MDSRIPTADQCVLRNLLDNHAKTQPEKIFARFQDHSEWTYMEMRDRARRISGTYHRLGVKQGDNIFCWLPNGPDILQCWFGANYMGAIFISANIAYRGGILEHILRLANARLGIIHADLLPRLNEISVPNLERIIVIGGPASGSYPGIELIDQSVLSETSEPAPLDEPIQPWHSAYVIYTSGTTGPSKAVLSSYIHASTIFTEAWPHLCGQDERHLVFLPMFHAGGTSTTYAQLAMGGSVAVIESFKTKEFWQMVRDMNATAASLMGVMATFLLRQPPSPEDKNHCLKAVGITPLSDNAHEFSSRFGVDIYTGYGMSEICGPLSSEANPSRLGTSGKLRPGFQVRLVDDNDYEVPVGEIGEFIMRTDRPWQLFTEYYGDPAATAAAWRNGWFHSGDLMRKDEEGYYYFIDRKKDAIRRRGENISSYEVETEILMYPAVREVAAFAAKNEVGEDEVMICISVAEGKTLANGELIDFLISRMPHYMIPRYIRIMDELPKTPTGRILKDELRKQGITHDSWDREADGIVIKRQKIGA